MLFLGCDCSLGKGLVLIRQLEVTIDLVGRNLAMGSTTIVMNYTDKRAQEKN